MRAWLRTIAFASLTAAGSLGCAHLAPASAEGVPPPWPAADPPVGRKASGPQPPAREPEGKPVVPPSKREVPPVAPNLPQSE